MMKKIFLNKRGFTLIELIASLVILGIIGTVVILSSIKILEGFIFTKMNATTSQKAHIALNRLTKEFTNITSVTSGNSTEIYFESRNYLTGATQTVRRVWKDGNTILIGSVDILVDNVSDFVLTYYDEDGNGTTTAARIRKIEITLKLSGANNTEPTFITRISPRRL